MGDNSEEQCLEGDSDSRHQADDSRTSSKADSKLGDNNSYHSSGISDDEDPVRKSQNKMDILPDNIDGAYADLTEPISKSTSPKCSDTDSSSDDEVTNLQAHHKHMSRIPNADSDSENNSAKDKSTSNTSDDDPDPDIDHKNTRLQKTNRGSESDMSNTKPITSQSKISDESSDEDVFSIKHIIKKSRIQIMTSSDDEEKKRRRSNDGLPQSPERVHKNAEQQARIKNKMNKLKNKFDVLTKSRQRDHVEVAESERLNGGSNTNSKSSDNSDEEIESIMEIKKNNRKQQLESLYDPDTSDEELGSHVGKSQPNKKSQTKKRSTMLISPKPQVRMSAKQAMDNMKKIRSESNRLLREKEVSLPYHRPKALSLKDIMSRSKPALMADGKAMPLKMNEQQLKQYAQMLDERQKEMMVLCKSDSDDEEPDESNDLITNDAIKTVNGIEIESNHLAANENSNIAIESYVNKEEEKDANMGEEKRESENIEGPGEVSKIDKDVNEVAIQGNNAGKETNVDMETDKYNQSETTGRNLVDADKTVENNVLEMTNDDAFDGITNAHDISTVNTEQESQLISLHYDSEKITTEKAEDSIDSTHENNDFEKGVNEVKNNNKSVKQDPCSEMVKIDNDDIHTSDNMDAFDDGFSDDDIDMQDIDRIIENADIISENQVVDSPMLIREAPSLKSKPKLTGAPGMVIDLDGTDAAQPKKLSGVELLKERFSYFSKLKTPQEMERTREKSSKPGTLHFKLKYEMEDEIANQRSLEWEKRLEEEKQQHSEMNAIRGDDDDPDAEDDLDDIEKIEAKLAEIEPEKAEDSSESEEEEELVEDDMVIEDKPKKRNPLITDEAEESDCDDEVDKINSNADEVDGDDEIENNEDEESSDDESSDDEVENELQPKKGRILKAFEDSDEEDASKETNNVEAQTVTIEDTNKIAEATISKNTQDDELPSAQFEKSVSEDIFASQDTDLAPTSTIEKQITLSNKEFLPDVPIDKSSLGDRFEKMPVICETQPFDEAKLDDIVGMCSGSFSQPFATQPAQPTQTQEISDDILALCTGQFYNNQFITQANEEQNAPGKETPKKMEDTKNTEDGNVLKSILDELDGPDFAEKPKKFFSGEKENVMGEANTQKKRLVIDSDDEDLKPVEGTKKKQKKKRLQDRALQISDDEEDLLSGEEIAEDYMSDLEDEGDMERVVEYDSEENEVEVMQPQPMKKKRKAAEFFEQEAELSSEDEWVGSGDEDEAGLDRMEREAGDDDKFNQARLQRELGEIHMRDVLDQDKRDVRLLQELLFEDGDLGTGHRQRKFRWRTEEGDEGMGSAVDEFGDTQEEEFESEEMWRKQRHEREVFLRQMQQQEGDGNDITHVIDRSALIKANLTCNDVRTPAENPESPAVKKPVKDIPSPAKKPFSLQQLNVRGSLLSRGDSALARLGALAGPLAGEAPHTLKAGKRNFVFAAVSPTPDDQPKVTKRKISSNPGTPHLMKKLKTEDKHLPRSSLLDHMKA